MRIRFTPLLLVLACGHAPPKAATSKTSSSQAAADRVPRSDARAVAASLSDESHAVQRAQAELLWTRWTTGNGPLPSGALAGHARLFEAESIRVVGDAAVQSSGDDATALRLLQVHLATQAAAQKAAAETEALDRARAQLSFAAPGDARPERGERDLDRLLTDEPDAKKRAAIALAEAQAAKPLGALVLARDAAVERELRNLDAGSWAQLEERLHGISLFDLATVAERTLALTDEVATRALDEAAARNLGVSADRLRRGDLPRLVRTGGVDAEFPAGAAWDATKATFAGIGIGLTPALRVDAEPLPSKGARPLALLVDPPADVRLSLKPSGGYDEQRATLHEGARALGGILTRRPRWELSLLGDGAGAEIAAQLFEDLAAEPQWLRDRTKLRGEPLDELVHTQATRRLLTARRAAALVLFEIRRREGAQTEEAQAALYRGLLQKATFAVLSDDDGNRWALEADTWVRAAPLLTAMLVAAQVEEKLATQDQPWWRAQDTAAAALRTIWSGGRSLSALEAVQALGLNAIDPQALARVAASRLAYTAPEAPPPAEKPDYKYMQGDKKKRRRKKR